MAKLLRRRWRSQGVTGLPRRDRQSCQYDAYLPDKLQGRPISLDGDVAADVADAEAAIARLNTEGLALTGTEVLARLLLRAESVASSKIEGIEIGGRRLLRADLARDLGEQSRDVTADDVLRNVDAMVWALQSSATEAITVDALLEIHRRLLAGTRLEVHAGHIRTEQNWIGGSTHNPCSATYVPPPPEHVADLLDDLRAFCNQDSLPAVVQAALAHAQFETIHPFVDGNGRTGRALIHLVLRRRGLAPRVLPPVSLILATWAQDYVQGLTATRYVGDWDSDDAHAGINHWLALFATACRRAVEDASSFEARIRELQVDWRVRLGAVRRKSALDQLVQVLPGAPIITSNSVASLTGRSFQAANEAIQRLVDAGILVQVNVGRRNRAFEARDIVDAFAQLERQLASPAANTRVSNPTRAVPPRIQRA